MEHPGAGLLTDLAREQTPRAGDAPATGWGHATPQPARSHQPAQFRLWAADQAAAVGAAARAEGHGLLWPTHSIWQAGRPVGYMSLGRLPVLTGWVSRTVDDAATQTLWREAERMMWAMGAPGWVMPTTRDCRFGPFMAQFGYARGKLARMWLKERGKDYG